MITRRQAICHSIAAGSAGVLTRSAVAGEADNASAHFKIVDTNVSLHRWPFRRLPNDDTASLAAKLGSLGISQAWAGSFDGLLHRDIAGVNGRVAAECSRSNILCPVGTINLMLEGWRHDLRVCDRKHGMRIVRLYPNYHGYTLQSSVFAEFLKHARDAAMLVQIAAAVEDTRTQHPRLQTADVDLSPLLHVLPEVSGSAIQILNYRPRGSLHTALGRLPGVWFDTARVDSTDGVPKLVQSLPAGRVLFGTHAPMLIPEAALIRVHESGVLNDQDAKAVLSGNADELQKGCGDG